MAMHLNKKLQKFIMIVGNKSDGYKNKATGKYRKLIA